MSSRKTFCKAVDDDFKAPDIMKGHGYEIVEDLVLNAERRATLERYDEAVARLYRALELLAQVCLWQHSDYTGRTKTLSAALVLAAVDNGIPLYLTIAATRENLVKMERGELTRLVDTSFRR